jgi:hypothetical protein
MLDMTNLARDIAEHLWQLLQRGDREVITADDSTLVGALVSSLEIPESSPARTPVTVPARSPHAAVVLEVDDGCYAVRAGAIAELPRPDLPVEIGTRNGVVMVDATDPLARAQRSIASLEELKF